MDKLTYVQSFMKKDTFSDEAGIRITAVDKDSCTSEMVFNERTQNCMGNLHGGAIFTQVDVSAGCALSLSGRKLVTLDAQINFLGRAERFEKTIAQAKVIRQGNKIGVCSVEVYCKQTLIATATVTGYYFEK